MQGAKTFELFIMSSRGTASDVNYPNYLAAEEVIVLFTRLNYTNLKLAQNSLEICTQTFCPPFETLARGANLG